MEASLICAKGREEQIDRLADAYVRPSLRLDELQSHLRNLHVEDQLVYVLLREVQADMKEACRVTANWTVACDRCCKDCEDGIG